MAKTSKRQTVGAPLTFPNPSRSYNPTRRGIHFWGYEQTIEVAFFIEEDAISKIDPETATDESGFLRTFDTNCDRLRQVASTIYSRRRKADHIFSYVLTKADL